ncbi:MAG: RodZ domain-containing protein [Pseudomonadota bacterium]
MNEERVLSVGSYLRQERERRNISLESIAKVTRITLPNLEALERDDFRRLPAPVFTRGFLRTYVSYLGIDPQEVLALYEAQVDFSTVSPKIKIGPPPKKTRPLVKFTLILFILSLAAGILFSSLYKQTPAPPPSPPLSVPEAPRLQTPPDKTPPAEEFPSPEKDLLKTPAAFPPLPALTPDLIEEEKEEKKEEEKKEEERHILSVKATELTWLRVQSDDQKKVEALLRPQEKSTWTARRQFKITVGNAGGVEIFFNGVPQGRLGASGEVVHLLLPKEIKEVKEKVAGEEKKEP